MRRFHLLGLLIGAALLAAVTARHITAPPTLPVAPTPLEPADVASVLPRTASTRAEVAATTEPALAAPPAAMSEPDAMEAPRPLVGTPPPAKYTGFWRTWHPHGQLAGELAYRNGQLDGPWRIWYADGLPKEDATYREGKLDGRFRMWHPGGRLASDIEFRNGVQDGQWMLWNERGQPQLAGRFRNGIPDGSWSVLGRSGTFLETVAVHGMNSLEAADD
ncbi:MAG: toxin-antitoxin system YwqK family antitoxin [Candidatus Omnitrophota bacterium]|nr:toxin-antitoxin system YwqK family antitoxin [Candidatus Omnitrophota bacterium]